MEHISENRALLEQVMDLIAKQFGTKCEVILHDYSKGPLHSITAIRNGHVTGRFVDGPNTNVGLEIMKGTRPAEDEFNYLTYAPNGKVLRSSSIYFKNQEGEPIGSLCLNLDITETMAFERFLREYNCCAEPGGSEEPPKEFFSENVHELMEGLIERSMQRYQRPPHALSKEEKIQFIADLDSKDVFIITNSSKRVSALLGISKYTFYNYLDIARRGREEKDRTGEDKQSV